MNNMSARCALKLFIVVKHRQPHQMSWKKNVFISPIVRQFVHLRTHTLVCSFTHSLSLSPYRFDVELRRFEHITKIRQITFSSSTTTSVCGSLWMRVPHQSGMSECRKRRNANFHKSFQFTLTHSSHFSVLYMSRFSIRFSNEINLSRARKINVNNTKNEQNVLKILWNRWYSFSRLLLFPGFSASNVILRKHIQKMLLLLCFPFLLSLPFAKE